MNFKTFRRLHLPKLTKKQKDTLNADPMYFYMSDIFDVVQIAYSAIDWKKKAIDGQKVEEAVGKLLVKAIRRERRNKK